MSIRGQGVIALLCGPVFISAAEMHMISFGSLCFLLSVASYKAVCVSLCACQCHK